MPLLSKDLRDRMLVQIDVPCRACGADVFRNYCRACDEFFTACACGAVQTDQEKHVGHRTYLCETPGCPRPVALHCGGCKKLICPEHVDQHGQCPSPPHPMGLNTCECFFLR